MGKIQPCESIPSIDKKNVKFVKQIWESSNRVKRDSVFIAIQKGHFFFVSRKETLSCQCGDTHEWGTLQVWVFLEFRRKTIIPVFAASSAEGGPLAHEQDHAQYQRRPHPGVHRFEGLQGLGNSRAGRQIFNFSKISVYIV